MLKDSFINYLCSTCLSRLGSSNVIYCFRDQLLKKLSWKNVCKTVINNLNPLLLWPNIRGTSWDIILGYGWTPTSCAVLPFQTLCHHDSSIVAAVQSLAIVVVRWCARDYCGRCGRLLLLLGMNMLAGQWRIRRICIGGRAFHPVMCIDWLSISSIIVASAIVMLLWVHSIATHWMRFNLLGIRVLMGSSGLASGHYYGPWCSRRSRDVLVSVAIATYSLWR